MGSWIVARPITLMLEDGGKDLSDLVYLAGPGNQFRGWNNTGVHKDLAVAAGPVHIPTGWKAVARQGDWSAYKSKKGPIVVICSRDRFGLVFLAHKGEPKKVLAAVAMANGDAPRLLKRFKHPDGHVVEYDVRAPKDKWVIKAVKGEKADRDFDAWPMLDGDIQEN